MYRKLSHLCYFFVLSSTSLLAQVTVIYPQTYMVIQRDNQDNGTIYITGTLSQPADRVEARLLAIPGEATTTYDSWVVIDNQVSAGSFMGQLTAKGGRYNLQVRAIKNNQAIGNATVVEKVGVGEVFLIVGHSNAAGGPDDGLAAQDNRVVSLNQNAIPDFEENYNPTADPDFLPTEFSPLTAGHGIAPFGGHPFLWGRFGDLIVEEFGVPVALYSAAFGGSNMEHTALSTTGQYFQHGFIKSSIRMPYINIENTLFHLAPKTGVRAVLSAHGVNDVSSSESQFYNNHKAVIDFSRLTAEFKDLTWMVAESCYNNEVYNHIASAQRNLAQLDNVFKGANLNSIGNEGRKDGLHFNDLGMAMAAERWRDAVVNPDFRNNSKPIMPEQPARPEGSLPVTLVDFKARESAEGAIEVTWSTAGERDNDYFEIQYSADGRSFGTAGRVKGNGTLHGRSSYQYTLRDALPDGSNLYLRLKQVDFDGTSWLSGMISVQVTRGGVVNSFYPNPSAGIFRFRTDNNQLPESIRVYDAVGLLKYEARNTDQIDLAELPVAAYLVEVQGKNGVVYKKRVVKI